MLDEEKIAALRAAGHRIPPMRMIKTNAQIEGCRKAGAVNTAVLDAVQREIHVGMTTEDIDHIVMQETKALGGIPACLGYEGFPKSVCVSVNREICHGIPSPTRILHEGDMFNVDCTTIYDGYFGDASRMFTLGTVGENAEKLIRVTAESVAAAEAHLVPYETHLADIGYYVGTHAHKNGYSVVREIGGHGVGLEMHEDPYVCHTGLLGHGIVLLPGMIFTIEPMINEGTARFYIDSKNGWTVYTADGKLSAQIEHEILMTDTGFEVISH